MSALPLESESLGDFDLTPEVDASLTALARQAKTDPAARNALYAALSFKINRFTRRYRYRADRLVICDIEDVAQEGFVVFCDLIASWPGRDSFPGYFFSRFPWRLARAIDVIERGWSAARLESMTEVHRHVPPLDPDEAMALVEIGAGLSPRDRAVLELHIGYQLRFSEIARVLDVHPRTVYRAWARIVAEVRRTWPTLTASRRKAPVRREASSPLRK